MPTNDLQEQLRQLWVKAIEHRKNGQWPQAVNAYSQILDLAPNFVPAYVERGLLVHEMGDPERAFHDFERAIQLDPQYGRAYYGRGWVRHTRGDFAGELDDAKRGLVLDRENAGMYYRRIGAGYQGLEQYQAAIHAYDEAINFYGGNDEGTIYNRGLCYMEMHDYVSALSDLDRSLEMDPDWAWAFAARGKVYLLMGNHQKAIEDCTMAIQCQPSYPFGYLNRALVYEDLKDTKRARADFEQLLKVSRSPQLKKIAEEHLKKLKGSWRLFG